MNKYVSVAIGAVAALTATSANAAQFITITGPSGNFGDDDVTCSGSVPCAFTRTFTFTAAQVAGFTLTSLNASTNAISAATDIDFSSITFNGVAFNTLFNNDTNEFLALGNQPILANNTIVVNGTSGGNASFTGNLNFTAVPEPGTWALMLVGFGAVGYSMRRRSASFIPQAV